MQWNDEAQKEIEKVPAFVRGMAKKAVEKAVKKDGRNEVSVEDVRKGRDKYISFAEKKAGDEGKQRIAIVRCETVSEVCPGIACFKAFNNRRLAFAGYDKDAEIIGFFTCGGCSGRRVSRLVDKLLKYNLTAVHLSSCMMLEDDYPRCPHLAEIKNSIESKGIKVVEGTHH
ncbi:MAG: CGGC domain-containing protein [Syntrophomonadaceae bacterium]|nr:CGGC domain-containing protein [Syntrophomonadaceae bacterium]MDD3024326.1 CGGC domain-containing protein [Syntrophomonadaceae bacterium]